MQKSLCFASCVLTLATASAGVPLVLVNANAYTADDHNPRAGNLLAQCRPVLKITAADGTGQGGGQENKKQRERKKSAIHGLP